MIEIDSFYLVAWIDVIVQSSAFDRLDLCSMS
jgi:hypothetical protein